MGTLPKPQPKPKVGKSGTIMLPKPQPKPTVAKSGTVMLPKPKPKAGQVDDPFRPQRTLAKVRALPDDTALQYRPFLRHGSNLQAPRLNMRRPMHQRSFLAQTSTDIMSIPLVALVGLLSGSAVALGFLRLKAFRASTAQY